MNTHVEKTLTLQKCNCGSRMCERHGFKEGMFYQGCGFTQAQAEEIKHRYDLYQPLLDALVGILEIGKRDMTNDKYDGYFTDAKTVLKRAGWKRRR